MPYSAQADLENAVGGADRLVDLADWNSDTVADAGVLTDAIAKADALIDSFASKRFTVPFNPVPVTIRETSAELAVLTIRRRRTLLGPQDELRWEQLAGEHGWLRQLADGIVTPGGDPLPLKHSTMAPDEATTELPCDREVSRRKLEGFW